MYQNEHTGATRSHKHRKAKRSVKMTTLVISLLVILVVAAGGTLAYLATKTVGITNTFTPSEVTCTVTEEFNGTDKTNVNVTNTGDTEAYIRVKLVTYRVDKEDPAKRIGGTATIPDFDRGAGWVEHDGYYYYTKPVKPGDKPENDLISSITLEGNYTEPDGGKQVIEVMAEAIQSQPASAVQEAWGVTVGENGTLNVGQ